MFYQLPPVGDQVLTSKRSRSTLPSFFLSDATRFYQSGTAALGAALGAVLSSAKAVKSCAQAEVILPAYACPDLISAAIYAGVKPILVDLEENRPWLALNLLEQAITQNTIAIVAVNLFGLAERWASLRALSKKHELVLIEDSAQYFPGKNEAAEQEGDLVIFSFGRGKPVSLLGGGAVLCRDSRLFKYLVSPKAVAITARDKFSFILKSKLYNVMISPYLYWVPQSLPFLHLGETRYHELAEITAMDSQRLDLLMANIVQYQNNDWSIECRKIMKLMLGSIGGVIDLPEICGVKNNRRLLRYPLLVEPTSRARVYHALTKLGLGASTMYPTSLVNVAGLEHVFDDKQKYPNAEKFASMILTISVKACVSDKHIKKMRDVFNNEF